MEKKISAMFYFIFIHKISGSLEIRQIVRMN